MSYLYKNRCYETVTQLHEVIAADCPPVSGNYVLECTPSSSNILISKTSLIDGSTSDILHTPAQIVCDPSIADVVALGWQLALILAAGFAIRALIKIF